MVRNLFPFIYEKFDALGEPTIEAHHDDVGTIGSIWIYSAVIDAMVKVDLSVFENSNRAAFTLIQTGVDGVISAPDFQQTLKYY